MQLAAEQWWTVFSALREIADWPRARFAAESMLAAVGAGDDPESRRLRWVAQGFLAETLARDPESREDIARAERLFVDGLALSRALARELDTPEARRDVSVALVNVALLAAARGDRSSAAAALNEARVAAEAFGVLQPLSDAADLVAAIDRMLAEIGGV